MILDLFTGSLGYRCLKHLRVAEICQIMFVLLAIIHRISINAFISHSSSVFYCMMDGIKKGKREMIDIFNLLTIIAALYLASSGEALMTFATKRKYGVRLEQIVCQVHAATTVKM